MSAMWKYRQTSPEQHEAAYHARTAAERAQASLTRQFEALAALIPAEVAEHHGVKSLLEDVEVNVAAQKLASKKLLGYIPREFRKPEAAAELARKVFGTPELLEKILLDVETRTVFNSYRVSKDFFNTIEGSLKLQRKLGLMADPDAHISHKARGYITIESGLRWEMSTHPHVETDYGMVVPLQMSAIACEDRMEQIRLPGPRLRSVLLTQPPIKLLDLHVTCCDKDYGVIPVMSIQSGTGITVGEVRDKIVQLRDAHRLCPHAPFEAHRDDGMVEPRIILTGDLLLREDDYSVLDEREMDAEDQRRDDEQSAFGKRINSYIRAKKAAHTNYLPIPTLATFEDEKARRMGLHEDG